MQLRITLGIALIFTLAAGCGDTKEPVKSEPMKTYAIDSHSFGKPNDVAVTNLSLEISVDFENRTIAGDASYDLARNGGDTLILDSRNLSIEQVVDAPSGKKLDYKIEKGNAMGDALKIALSENTNKVKITYRTSPNAAAVLWMEPEQTLGKTMPFMFTQGQAILTRTWIPIQDSPAIRITYDAKVTVPKGMMALMSATNPTEKNGAAVYLFRMEQPIPPYLMALAAGDLAFEPLGKRSGVYAEPAMLEKAAYEFADVEKMIDAAESLYGPYRWDRYDLLVLPPSFPFGGMENPRLTFATPTIIAGDRSLTSLVAHELAHSWSGNLVTNATWDDFWLNEGFTVYFEKRIMEAVYGKDYADMLNQLGMQDLLHTIEKLGADNADTKLKLDLDGRDPDAGMTDIAYEKGYLFLRWLESIVGREKFDSFLKNYFSENAFQTMTTERFTTYLEKNLLAGIERRPDIEAWIYEPGLPANYPEATSLLFDTTDSLRGKWLEKEISTADIPTANWTSHEWLHFLRGLPNDLSKDRVSDLDEAFQLTETNNSEIAAVWFLVAIRADYRPAFPAMEKFLTTVGRRKFLEPIYEELVKTEDHKAFAKRVYEKARPNYHSVAVGTIDGIVLSLPYGLPKRS